MTKRRTVVAIEKDAFTINARPTYPGQTHRGQPLLFNEDDYFGFGRPENHMLAALSVCRSGLL
jgi:hypothetical protein